MYNSILRNLTNTRVHIRKGQNPTEFKILYICNIRLYTSLVSYKNVCVRNSLLFLIFCVLFILLGRWSSPFLPINPKIAHAQNTTGLRDALMPRENSIPEEDNTVILSSQSAEYIKPYEDSTYHLTLIPYRGKSLRVSGMIYPSEITKDTLVWIGSDRIGYHTVSISSLDRSGPARNEPSYFEIVMNVPSNADILEYGFTNVGYSCILLPKFSINMSEKVL